MDITKIMTKKLKRNTCLLIDCGEETIQAHSISKKISLQSISERQKLIEVYIKQVSNYRKKPFFQEIGINQATTSLCFCKKHDEIFNELDKYGIRTFENILYQFLRSMSILYNEEKNSLINIVNLKLSEKELINLLTENIKSNPSLSDKNLSDMDIKEILNFIDIEEVLNSIEENNQLNFGNKWNKENLIFKELVAYVNILHDKYRMQNVEKNKLYVEDEIEIEESNYLLFFYIADFQIPVAVNAFNKFSIGDNLFNYYNIVVPLETETIIICLLPKKVLNRTNLNFINKSFFDKLGVLNFVESIIAANDGWYIKPSIINNMPENKKKILLEDCMFINERKFYEPYDLSIFDDLRREFSLELNSENELNKISYIPKRKNFEDRHKNLLKFISKNEFNGCELILPE